MLLGKAGRGKQTEVEWVVCPQVGLVRPGPDALAIGQCDCLLKVRWIARETWQQTKTNHSSTQRWWACWTSVFSSGPKQVMQRGFALPDTRPRVTNLWGSATGVDKLVLWNRIILIISNTQHLPCAGQCFKCFMYNSFNPHNNLWGRYYYHREVN